MGAASHIRAAQLEEEYSVDEKGSGKGASPQAVTTHRPPIPFKQMTHKQYESYLNQSGAFAGS